MADQPTRRSSPPQERRPAPSGPHRVPGWRVTPAPDGRGAQPDGGPPPRRARSRWWLAGFGGAPRALNLWISSQALKPNSPIRVPYSPTFLTQVKDGNVKEISSTGDAIQGTFKKAIKYPSNEKDARTSTSFATQVPSFADNQELSNLLQPNGVPIDAQPPK